MKLHFMSGSLYLLYMSISKFTYNKKNQKSARYTMDVDQTVKRKKLEALGCFPRRGKRCSAWRLEQRRDLEKHAIVLHRYICYMNVYLRDQAANSWWNFGWVSKNNEWYRNGMNAKCFLFMNDLCNVQLCLLLTVTPAVCTFKNPFRFVIFDECATCCLTVCFNFLLNNIKTSNWPTKSIQTSHLLSAPSLVWCPACRPHGGCLGGHRSRRLARALRSCHGGAAIPKGRPNFVGVIIQLKPTKDDEKMMEDVGFFTELLIVGYFCRRLFGSCTPHLTEVLRRCRKIQKRLIWSL